MCHGLGILRPSCPSSCRDLAPPSSPSPYEAASSHLEVATLATCLKPCHTPPNNPRRRGLRCPVFKRGEKGSWTLGDLPRVTVLQIQPSAALENTRGKPLLKPREPCHCDLQPMAAPESGEETFIYICPAVESAAPARGSGYTI